MDSIELAEQSHYIPEDVLKKILLNLPEISLVRFSCVSKSWNSMIFDLGYIDSRHRGESTSHGRERIIISPSLHHISKAAYSCTPSSIFWSKPVQNATTIVCPIPGNPPLLQASSDKFWCVQVDNSLFLWNPLMSTYRKLPQNSSVSAAHKFQFLYGLGYDSAGDDYKLLKIPRENFRHEKEKEGELYSMKSNSWRKIHFFSEVDRLLNQRCAFVNGALHWIGFQTQWTTSIIISFNLSTDNYAELVAPDYDPNPDFLIGDDNTEVSVLKGKLCVCLNFYKAYRFVLWTMEDYGMEKSWKKMIEINCNKSLPYLPFERLASCSKMRPFYLYDNGDMLVQVSGKKTSLIFMYKKNTGMLRKVIGRYGRMTDCNAGYVHVN